VTKHDSHEAEEACMHVDYTGVC